MLLTLEGKISEFDLWLLDLAAGSQEETLCGAD
jgi:hypothetical protein